MANFQEMAIFFAINNVEEHENNVHNERQTRNTEYITDPFILSDRLFIKNFRLTKDDVRYLIDLLRPHIISNTRSSAIDLTKIFTTLNFLATGSYQSPIGYSKFMVLSQPTVSQWRNYIVA
ncbi:putative nuclease HARBI1 [Aphis craccivora]|uniref:Putative nuclease HARBI1 n=1 Tax=Aphis craccivora TaxID=307492 RepID=A0A6G0VIF3_APHCR|nr:putative nuclease HARBI1 [Aphis craccivora]